jgi:hypothetical protein
VPDPKDPTPVTVEEREGLFVVIDKDGDALPGQSAKETEEEAGALAARVNGVWSSAKAERKAKGGPAVTREARVERRTARYRELLG